MFTIKQVVGIIRAMCCWNQKKCFFCLVYLKPSWLSCLTPPPSSKTPLATLNSPSTEAERSQTCESRDHQQTLVAPMNPQTLNTNPSTSIPSFATLCSRRPPSICHHAGGVECMKLLSRDAAYADAPTEGNHIPLHGTTAICVF